MSSVRMCDKCGDVFSELQEDWSTMSGTQFFTNPNTGKRERREVEMDVCGKCNRVGLSGDPLKPRIPIEADPGTV